MDYAIFKGKVIFDKMNPALENGLKISLPHGTIAEMSIS